jgi:hypothetical protein
MKLALQKLPATVAPSLHATPAPPGAGLSWQGAHCAEIDGRKERKMAPAHKICVKIFTPCDIMGQP